MSRRTPFRVYTRVTTTSANSLAMMIGPSWPPSRGTSSSSAPGAGHGPAGVLSWTADSSSTLAPFARGRSDEDRHVVGVDDRLIEIGPPGHDQPAAAVRSPPVPALCGE